jgi:tRNA A-37 threonylcarbamoyl transferase component Bud32
VRSRDQQPDPEENTGERGAGRGPAAPAETAPPDAGTWPRRPSQNFDDDEPTAALHADVVERVRAAASEDTPAFATEIPVVQLGLRPSRTSVAAPHAEPPAGPIIEEAVPPPAVPPPAASTAAAHPPAETAAPLPPPPAPAPSFGDVDEEITGERPAAPLAAAAPAPEPAAAVFDERPTPVRVSRFSPADPAGVRPIAELVLDYLAFEKAVPRALALGRRASLVDLMAAPAAATPAATPAAAAIPDEEIIAGRYRIEDQLGEGGMGKVFRVRHLQLDKAFALKLIHVNANSSPRARELFYREAKLASSLAHPNIVTIVDFGEDPRRGAFMVMELVEGEPLSVHLHRLGRLAAKPAIDVILQIAEALHYIHGRQIVHCDIKPENIFLCRLPSTERRKFQVKLLDFGLARTGAVAVRTTQNIEGTPAYLAPERIRSQAPQASMDIYSLGVVSYELLTGRLPFDGSMYEIMSAHINKPPPPLSTHVPDGVDESLEGLIMRALAKEPKDRQKDMAAFLYELRTVMDMLGMGRRRANPIVVRESTHDRRERGVLVGYDATPLPMAGVDVDGTIVVANRAFALFAGDGAVEGKSLYDTKLQTVCPDLRECVRRVHTDGAAQSLVLALRAPDGTEHRLMLWLVPGTEDGGRVHLTVHGLQA